MNQLLLWILSVTFGFTYHGICFPSLDLTSWLLDLFPSCYFSPCQKVVKNLPANAGDRRVTGSIQIGKTPWRKAQQLPTCMENSMDIGTWWAWRIPWTKEPGELQPTGSQRMGHNWSDLPHTDACIQLHGGSLWDMPFKTQPWNRQLFSSQNISTNYTCDYSIY